MQPSSAAEVPSPICVRVENSKTHAQRDIPMTPAVGDALLELHRRAVDPARGQVFLDAEGHPWRNSLDKRSRACAQAAGLVSQIVWRRRRRWLAASRREAEAMRRDRCGQEDRRVVIHSLRHTFATELLRSGVSIGVVSRLLRHASVKQALDTYQHVPPEDREAAIAKLNFGSSVAADPQAGSRVLCTSRTYNYSPWTSNPAVGGSNPSGRARRRTRG